jgi:hypothetical protein
MDGMRWENEEFGPTKLFRTRVRQLGEFDVLSRSTSPFHFRYAMQCFICVSMYIYMACSRIAVEHYQAENVLSNLKTSPIWRIKRQMFFATCSALSSCFPFNIFRYSCVYLWYHQFKQEKG